MGCKNCELPGCVHCECATAAELRVELENLKDEAMHQLWQGNLGAVSVLEADIWRIQDILTGGCSHCGCREVN